MSEILKQTVGTNLTLAEKLRLKRNSGCLLLDISGSMASELEPGQTKLQALKDIVIGLNNLSSPIFPFASNVTQGCVQSNIQTLRASGGTNMALAINFAKGKGYRKIVMITDGKPDSEDLALKAVKDVELRILYVGPEPKPAFLDKLAQAGASFCTQEDLKNTKELTNKVQLLLESGEVRGAIQL